MNLNIRLVAYLFLVCGMTATAQIFGEKTGGINSYKVASLSTGLLIPSGVGDNFVSNGAKSRLGLNLNFSLNVYDNLYLGFRFDAFGLKIEDETFSGSYSRSTTYAASGVVGYKFINKEKFAVGFFTGIGGVSYGNKRTTGVLFTEDGTSYFLTADAELKINRYFQFYVAPELRFDRLNIDAPAQVSDQLNKISYFIVNAGLRVSFWNSEPEDEEEKE
ncbi:MAG: hypothetical protein ACSHW7_04820 [Patiriisocius sp.]|uniref:hypothetical protein n=1 Tax=Patiriisocius sp. TaxID=2822396 RepID=UPI003EF17CF4